VEPITKKARDIEDFHYPVGADTRFLFLALRNVLRLALN
jgi:hypothetical protein